MKDRDVIYRKLKESRKYKHLCDDTLYRIAGWAIERYTPKKAEKAAKNKLHQVYGAFFEKINVKKINKLLAGISAHPDNEILKRTAGEILKFHRSTAERIPVLETFYRDLFSRTGTPKKVLDLACGLNPFSIQWMNLEPDAEYLGLDIDSRLSVMINTYFKYLNRSFRAECADILVSPPEPVNKPDMILILKTLPSLEQQEKGAGERLLKSIKAKYIVVSFPAKSLSGHEKGMETHYNEFILDILNRLSFTYFKMEYPAEIFYIITPN